jgi:predicted Zn-ribbon and HTH transcriptional regulator
MRLYKKLRRLRDLLLKTIFKIRCLIGIHDTTSYSEELNFEHVEMVRVSKKISDDYIFSFFELSAIRCKHCGYRFRAKTKNDFSLLNK